ncbi:MULTISPECIES: sulfite exporter TauE/SafE family protein [unclassified Paracoccus (in: a-proteobacteria)]|uniref:sulfite exporter TauE/SafE family protein n=1 Tax=unclassified Paracoccus (in: a-proteobacteria) TaxID=2688777 RepID=UPI0012B1FE5D|nr:MULTISPECIES: sulfite exporter TauE/SafE family protein [unclassified Paracoccus (in: a-proteobacteria)]UXU73927.1 sulfite exporter TauE/SafE family protein [Paracoccus sp. SMMA_5]UXU79814.1 sulfite exporter TauE/SafE family protein [Paracoccus sp. SMMA_5_TC]
MAQTLLMLAAGFLGGMLNAVAGGGTFITFPALVASGVPVVSANATSTVAALPGYLSAAVGFRHEIAHIERGVVLRLTLWTLVGGIVGSCLLLVSSNAAFAVLVPFLLLGATSVFIWGAQVRSWAARHRSAVVPFGIGTMLPVAIYGGYFNGGLGIILLALFALWGMTDLNQMNGLKSWLSFALSVISFVIFAIGGQVAWGPAVVMSLGTILGGYLGAPLARRIPMPMLRALIAAVGFGMTALFFWRLF